MKDEKPDPKQVVYESIPGFKNGEICLSIYRPGGFINNTDFHAFVGGCGVGGGATLKDAEKVLLDRAKLRLRSYIEEAKEKVEHYTRELVRLELEGLRRKKNTVSRTRKPANG